MLCVVFRLSLVAAAPAVFAGYLVLLGFTSLLMRAIGWSLPHAFQRFLIIAGLLIVFVSAFSGKVRSSVPDRLF
jgi:hypothetical protein